jgi:hypothetical protein
MTKKSLMLLLALLALAVAASAADISGTWKGTAKTPNGPVERTFNFKVDGNNLTGDTTSNMFGKSTIEDGKIDGDSVSFTITVKMDVTVVAGEAVAGTISPVGEPSDITPPA